MQQQTSARDGLVRSAIEVYGKLVEMGETVETSIMFMQDNNAVIRMSETSTAHAGSKHLHIFQTVIHNEVRGGPIKCRNVTSDENNSDFLTKTSVRLKLKKDTLEVVGPGWINVNAAHMGAC